MYSLETHRFNDSSEMMDYLKTIRPSVQGDPIGIVGGHFMLLYDKKEDCLKPVIHQDLEDPKLKNFAKLMAEDFPVNSFEYSLELIKNHKNNNIQSKIILVVNDHIFQSNSYQIGIEEKIYNRGGVLRKRFYHTHTDIPKVFKDMLNEKSLGSDVIHRNIKKSLEKNSTQPKETYFFSEKYFRNRFEDKTEKKLRKHDQLVTSINEKGEREIFYKNNRGSDICLTENGDCGCSLEVVEFIKQLININYNTVIFFVPKECEKAVNLGVEVVLNITYKKNKSNISVFTITGLENKDSNSITVFKHANIS